MYLRPWICFMVLLALVFGCARMEPPPGGAIDQIPAELVASWPEDGSSGHGSLSNVTLTFDEAVDRVSVLENLRTDPPWLLRSVRWQADTLLSLRFWEPFPADTTVSLYLEPGWRDRHRVEQPQMQIVNFATGDELLAGWLAGSVTFKGAPSRAMHLKLSDSTGAFQRSLLPDRQGNFAFRHLPVDGRTWRLTAWQDADEDSLFDPAVDFSDSFPDSLLVLDAGNPVRLDLSLNVIDPNEPGEIKGRVTALDTLTGAFLIRFFADSLRLPDDSVPPTDPFALPPSLIELLSRPAETPHIWVAEAGEFSFDGVAPGNWWLLAHKDLVGDSLWDPAAEPAALDPGPRRLEPGGTLSWPRIEIHAFADTTAAPEESVTVKEDSP